MTILEPTRHELHSPLSSRQTNKTHKLNMSWRSRCPLSLVFWIFQESTPRGSVVATCTSLGSSHLRLSVLVVVCWSRELTPPSSKCWLQQTQGLADRLTGRLGKHCHCAPTRAKGSHPLSFGRSLAFSESSHLPLTSLTSLPPTRI